MRRTILATASLALVMSLGSAGAAAASSTADHGADHVKAGSTWTVEASGLLCETQTFSRHHLWTGDSGGSGSYTGGRSNITETWTSGTYDGSHFMGTYQKKSHQYEGTYDPAHGADYSAVLTRGDSNCQTESSTPTRMRSDSM
jgi:hypothetical protein